MKMNIDTSGMNLDDFYRRFENALLIYASTASKSMESYAKENRPWTDRTGRARQGLTGSYEKVMNGIRIAEAHTVDYGLFLEYAREGKYAILEPTVRLKGPEIIRGMNNLMKKVGM